MEKIQFKSSKEVVDFAKSKNLILLMYRTSVIDATNFKHAGGKLDKYIGVDIEIEIKKHATYKPNGNAFRQFWDLPVVGQLIVSKSSESSDWLSEFKKILQSIF